MFTFLSNFIGNEAGGAVLLPLTVVLCAIFLEDLTVVIVGVLAADSIIAVPVALLSLYVGSALGDAVFYSLGWLARTHPRLARYIDHDFTASFRSWLESRYAHIIFSGHFVPGLRSTTYIASGFFRRPLSIYIPAAISGGMILVTALFSASYWFGSFTSQWVGVARWGVAGVFLLVLFFVGRHNLLTYQARRNKSSPLIQDEV
jgi:membrane protein DedA with SNARE-associated domain